MILFCTGQDPNMFPLKLWSEQPLWLFLFCFGMFCHFAISFFFLFFFEMVTVFIAQKELCSIRDIYWTKKIRGRCGVSIHVPLTCQPSALPSELPVVLLYHMELLKHSLLRMELRTHASKIATEDFIVKYIMPKVDSLMNQLQGIPISWREPGIDPW